MAKKAAELTIKNTLTDGVKKYFKQAGIEKNKSTASDFLAKSKMALSLLNFCLNGSKNSSRTPPVLTGDLRGSGSVFVGNKMIQDSKGASKGTPNTTYSENPDTITIGFNTEYATKIHENLEPAGGLQLGTKSREAGDAGGKFVEEHLDADKESLLEIYAKFFKKDTGG